MCILGVYDFFLLNMCIKYIYILKKNNNFIDLNQQYININIESYFKKNIESKNIKDKTTSKLIP